MNSAQKRKSEAEKRNSLLFIIELAARQAIDYAYQHQLMLFLYAPMHERFEFNELSAHLAGPEPPECR